MFRIKVLLASTLTIILVLTIQYSGAQGIVSISKEGILTPNEEPQVEAQEPAQEESLDVDVNEDKPETKGEEESEEEPRFTCMSDSVDKPTRANCTITDGGVSTSYDCNADATTKIWNCVEETAKTSTDELTLNPSAKKAETLKQIIQNMR
ncbi:MAG TPA: hypothetical protein VFY55_00205 [Nitrososphaeraceae archaeon]|nr:hypothetical protein [Nitrososphaeraceae archaeon]